MAALDFDSDASRRIQHIALQAQLLSEVINKRPETNPLNDPTDLNLLPADAWRQHILSWHSAAKIVHGSLISVKDEPESSDRFLIQDEPGKTKQHAGD